MNVKQCKKSKSSEYWVKSWHKRLYNSCKSRGFECDITPEYILHLYEKQNGKCYWFGVEMIRSSKRKDPQQPSLDRLNPDVGYVKGNVVLACFAANIGRNRTSPERFKEFSETLKRNYQHDS
jgi:hypothetical protein